MKIYYEERKLIQLQTPESQYSDNYANDIDAGSCIPDPVNESESLTTIEIIK